jgi:hypothetical protein
MDLGQIVYIIAIVVYFIYQASKKKKSLEPMDSDTNQPEAPQKGLTFEELLKEIRNTQNPREPEKKKEEAPQPVRPIPVSVERTETKRFTRKQFEPVEEVDDEASYYDGAFRSTPSPNPYQAMANRTFSEPEIKKVKPQDNLAKKINPYAELLKNPKSIRESIVVSEILRPKYF